MPPRRKVSGPASLHPDPSSSSTSSPSSSSPFPLQPATSLPFAPPEEHPPPPRTGMSSSHLNGDSLNGHTETPPTDTGDTPLPSSSTQTPGGHISAAAQKQMDSAGIDQFELPRAVVTRVSKNALPDNVQIRKEAVLAISKSATIFISYLAAVSDELAKQATRKTISVTDVMEGLGLMEFPEEIKAEVKANLKAFRQLEADKKNKSKTAVTAEGEEESEGDEEDEEEEGDTTTNNVADTTTDNQPPAQSVGEVEVDEEDEDTEQRMVQQGIDDEAEDDEEDEEMADE